MRTIGNLAELPRTDVPTWGGKAAALAELTSAGFDVPPGVVMQAGGPDADDADLVALATAAGQLGDVELAVRSSSVDEDQAQSSAAGRYVSVLHVQGPDAVRAATRACLASADGSPMAVLVQRQVAATAAGVAFSAHPVTGERSQVLINAVPGLADRLVSGEVTGEQWVVDEAGARQEDGEEAVLTRDQAERIADLARAVERHRGCPQDIEWALEGDRLHLVQARPITTLIDPVRVQVTVPGGYWMRGSSHYPQPMTPLTASVVDPNPGCLHMTSQAGLLFDLVSANIGGWYYVSFQLVGAPQPKPGQKPPALPAWAGALLLPALVLRSRAGRDRLRTARRGEREDHLGRLIRQWYDVHQPRIEARLAQLRTVDLDVATDAELADHLDNTVTLVHDGLMAHYPTVLPHWIRTAQLLQLCRKYLDWDTVKALDLLSGTSTTSSLPAEELARLATAELGPDEFAAAREQYLQRFGQRLLSVELADRSYAEIPGLLEDQLAAQRGYDPVQEAEQSRLTRESTAAEARSRLHGRRLREFDALLPRALAAYPTRDDNVFYSIEMPFAAARYAALAAGRRLTAAGVLDRIDDVFFCAWPELTACLRDTAPEGGPSLRALVHRRRGERAWYLSHPAPESYGHAPGDPPSFALFPPPVRKLMDAFLSVIGLMLEPELSARTSPSDDGALHGVPASPGTYTGTVRVIRSEQEFGRIQAGDVLVCTCTRPSWAVVFGSLGAIVTDVGGVLAHPAIIARELQIPAVVATGCATSMLQDGQTVTVDGTAGTVSLPAGP